MQELYYIYVCRLSRRSSCQSPRVRYSSIGTTIPERLDHVRSAVLRRKTVAPAEFQRQSVIPASGRGLTREYVPVLSPRVVAAPARSSTPRVHLLELELRETLQRRSLEGNASCTWFMRWLCVSLLHQAYVLEIVLVFIYLKKLIIFCSTPISDIVRQFIRKRSIKLDRQTVLWSSMCYSSYNNSGVEDS